MIQADTPNLWQLKTEIGELKTKAIVVYALAYMADLVNVERNLTEIQLGEIANDVLADYGYLKVEEVKYVLKSAIKSEKLFARLDYNVVMGWFKEYDAKRIELAMDISDQKETQAVNEVKPSENGKSFEQYMADLGQRVASGDETAAEIIRGMADETESRMKLTTAEEKRQRNIDFKQYYCNVYLKGKK